MAKHQLLLPPDRYYEVRPRSSRSPGSKSLGLLALSTFSVSFCLDLLVEQRWERAAIVGLIAVPAALFGVLVTEKSRTYRIRSTLTAMKNQIQVLQLQGTRLRQSLQAVVVEKQQTMVTLNSLQSHLQHIQNQVVEKWELNERLGHKLADLDQQKRLLEEQAQKLQQQVQQLEKQARGLSQAVGLLPIDQAQPLSPSEQHPLQPAVKQLQAQINSLQVELTQLEALILQRRSQKFQLEQEIANLKAQKFQVESTIPAANIPRSSQPLPTPPTPMTVTVPKQVIYDLPDDWSELMHSLPFHEYQVLKAIVQQDQPQAVLKQVAEEHLTMPELIIDAINERAIDILGDVIIEPGSGNIPPKISQEHLVSVKQLIAAYR